jgi:ATP-dependent DNA ligase
LLEAAERLQLEGIVSKRRAAPYRSGECRDWVKVKMAAWREANRER